MNRRKHQLSFQHEDARNGSNSTIINDHHKSLRHTVDCDPCKEFPCSCKPKILSRVFPEDFYKVKKAILDPQSPIANRWNKTILSACLLSLFIDPLFLFSPESTAELCTRVNTSFDVLLTFARSTSDVFYWINICIQFRTAYVAPSSRVLGRGELVIEPWKIASKYLYGDFWIHVLAALPIPQVIVWAVIPNVKYSAAKISLRFSIMLQYVLRLALIFPLSSKISKASGPVPKTARNGAAYNAMLYFLISHAAGACWYLLSLKRQLDCWREVCVSGNPLCTTFSFFDCLTVNDPHAWIDSSNVAEICDQNNDFYHYGIYRSALRVGTPSATFLRKYFFSFWWAFQSLSSIGNNLSTSDNVVENIFTNLIAVVGLILFALLLGNIQRYLQSTSMRLEEWRTKRSDTEQWMHHRQLPLELRHWVRMYDDYKWEATRGVNENALLHQLPSNLRREVHRHLCFNLLHQVPMFKKMDDHMLDAICERLKAAVCFRGAYILREGEPVNKMLFIGRGNLDSYTTNGGTAGFFNTSRMGPGNFCGEELLTWALNPSPSLPLSTHTVRAITETEAFCLMPEDLRYVATHFRKLHSKNVVHNFRFHSNQWKTWAACYIQAAWRKYKRHMDLTKRPSSAQEELPGHADMGLFMPQPGSGVAVYAARVLKIIKRGSSNRFGPDSITTTGLFFEDVLGQSSGT